MASTLGRLPPAAIRRIVDHDADVLPTLLHGVGSRSVFEATRQAIYGTLVLVDSGVAFSRDAKLATILNSQGYAECVRHLSVKAPEPWMSVGSSDDPTLPLDDRRFLDLLHRLPNLASFAWESDRLPPPQLCATLGPPVMRLQSFALDLQAPRCGSRHRSGSLAVSPSQSSTDDEGETAVGVKTAESSPLRWDAHDISSLASATLTRLFVSSLSAIGARTLGAAFQDRAWEAITDIELSKTLFVDDALVSAIAKGARRLERLTVREMYGTKLSEAGVMALTDGLMHLKALEFIDVEGRFSKASWLKFDSLPTSLHTLRFAYREERSHHSWAVDHLENIISVVSLAPRRIRSLSVARIVPEPCMVPARHDKFPALAIGPRLAPKRLTQEMIETIVSDGKALRELDLDYWIVSLDGLEMIVRGLPELQSLKVMLDAPFQRLIASAAFSLSKLKSLTVSIPSEHTPQLAEMASPGDTPTFEFKGLASPNGGGPPVSPKTPTASSASASPVHVRDMRKFLKKASHLHEIVWTGRGGLGMWQFERAGGINVKVDFIPISSILPPSAFTFGRSDGVGMGDSSLPSSPLRRRLSSFSPVTPSHPWATPSQQSSPLSKWSGQSSGNERRRGSSSATSASANSWTSAQLRSKDSNGLGLEGIQDAPPSGNDEADLAPSSPTIKKGSGKKGSGGAKRK